MDRAYSILSVKEFDDEKRTFTGIATTPSVDRMDDIVEPEGAEFELPIPFLWQHDSDNPVGHVVKARISKKGIEVEVQLKRTDEPGLVKERLDAAWQYIKLGLVRGLSIGFKGIETARIEGTYGIRFLKWAWLELSGVTIPANQDASIINIKAFDVGAPKGADDQKRTAAKTLSGPERSVKTPAGSAAKSTNVVRLKEPSKMKKPIAELIKEFESTRAAKMARLNEIQTKAADEGRSKDEAEKEEFQTLQGDIKSIDEELVDLRELDKANKASAADVNGQDTKSASESRNGERKPNLVVVRSNAPKGAGFVRMLAARFMAKEDHCNAADIAQAKGWGDDVVSALKLPRDLRQMVVKAAIAPASTVDSTWAGPLVVYQNLQGEFIELLRPKTLLSRIPGLRKVPFNVKVPRETAPTTGYWVGQGSPKPVSKGALDTVTLDFAKVAGITYQTQELLRFSQPNSEGVLINSLTKAITYLVDRDFTDPAKALVTGVSPASITNGVSAIAATGQTADAFRADFATALRAYAQANYTLDGLVVIMTQSQALSLGLMRNDLGGKEFPDINKDGGFIEGIPVVTTENIVANGGSPADGSIIVLLNASDILLADDEGVDVDISTEATIQADSAPDSPQTASTVMVSLWQNNLVGIRCERFVNWTKARTDSVAYISGANYR